MNGFEQATIAYKVRKSDGAPLDINGALTSVSGRLQAVLLLTGTTNPYPGLYEVQGYFAPGEVIVGNPTEDYDPLNCPPVTLIVTPARVVIDPGGAPIDITVYSTTAWSIISTPAGLGALDSASGGAGYSYLRYTLSGTQGQGPIKFINANGNTAQVYIIVTSDTSIWILQTGVWNDAGFWFANDIWNY